MNYFSNTFVMNDTITIFITFIVGLTLVLLHPLTGIFMKYSYERRYSKIMKTPESSIMENTKKSSNKKELPSISMENASIDEYVTQHEMNTISLKLRREQHRSLARELRLSDPEIDEIEVLCKTNNYGDGEIVYDILRTWKEKNGKAAKRIILKNALKTVHRRDIADELFSDIPDSIDVTIMRAQYKGIQQRIEENQRQRCKKIELPQVNWTKKILPLEQLYVNLELLKTVGEYENSKRESVQLEELFNQVDGKDPVRILIEGGPGYGKTTLCSKLLNDWGRIRSYISSKFKMVFLFYLRNCKENDSLQDMLKRECEAIGANGDDGIECIKAFEHETLLILDGFDELNEDYKRKFLPLLHKTEYPSMFVVLTSRRGMFDVKNKKQQQSGGYFEMVHGNVNAIDIWDKRVLIKGVTKDKIETFLRRYLEKDYQALKGKINSVIKGVMKEVFECPLFLILLAMILEEKTLDNVTSKTSLYKEFVNFIIKRNLIREKKLSEEEEVDIFNPSFKPKILRSLYHFGRLAIECLCKNKLTFKEKDVLKYCKDKMILKLGFLTKIPKLERHKIENFYQPIHKSFLEFVGAFAMWKLFKKDEQKFKKEMERLRKKGLKPTNDSLFYVFLGGFMNSKAYILFQSLTRYGLWFNIESLCFTNILLEIQDILSFFPSFQQILDSCIPSLYRNNGVKGLTRDYFQSEIHSLILKHSSRANRNPDENRSRKKSLF